MSFLDKAETKVPDLAELSQMAVTLSDLAARYEAAEAAYKEAKDAYDAFRCVTMPSAMAMLGLSQIATEDGQVFRMTTKYRCNPNKEKGKQEYCEWLRDQGAGFLLNEYLKVDESFKEKINVPYSEILDVNTNKMKAYLVSEIENGNMTLEDVPKEIGLWKETEVKVI